jgi:hypothetical protein
MKILDSGFRRNDEKKAFGTFYEFIRVTFCSMEFGFAQILKKTFEKARDVALCNNILCFFLLTYNIVYIILVFKTSLLES